MNLVKAQALANDLPIQELKKYADGFDPRIIPPWVAAGTMQSKMDLQKRMQNMIGGAQGSQPSVKEQIEQKAGLMAANTMQQRQQQAQQQMAMAGRPGPAPAGIPQPEDQPEAPVQMARGGLTSVPVQFAFKPGGIVGYSGENGSQVKSEEEMAKEQAAAARAALRTYGLAKMKEDPEGFKAAQEAARMAEERLRAISEQTSGGAAGVMGRTFERAAPVKAQPTITQRPVTVSEAQATAAAGPQAAVPAPRTERPAPRPEAAPRPAPAAQPAQVGLPAAVARSPYFAQADAALNEPNVKPTPESIIAEQRALSPQAMLEENMRKRYEERKARADQERAVFERTRPTGLQDLIRVLGQSAQYKGMSGMAPAYTANLDRKRAEEMALEKRINDLYNAADVQEFEGAKELFGARAGAMKDANRSYQERLKSRAETLAQLAGVDERRIQSELDRLSQMEIAKIRAADAGRGGPEMQYLAQYLKLKAEGKPQEAARLLEGFSLFKRGEPKPDPLQSALSKQYAEQLGAALQLPAGKLRDERMAGLALLEQRIKGGGGGGSFTVTAGGKTYTFPTQEAADKFKAEAGVK